MANIPAPDREFDLASTVYGKAPTIGRVSWTQNFSRFMLGSDALARQTRPVSSKPRRWAARFVVAEPAKHQHRTSRG